MRLILPSPLRDRLAAEARAAFPRECCGLVEGVRHGDEICALRLHPAGNLAAEPDRFEIDPAEQFRLLHALRDTGREIVGCYHSHPNGADRPSPRDRDGAAEDGLVWLIQPLTAETEGTARAFVFAGGEFAEMEMRELPSP